MQRFVGAKDMLQPLSGRHFSRFGYIELRCLSLPGEHLNANSLTDIGR